MRQVGALAVAFAVALASVADSAAACHDDGGVRGDAGAPSAPAPSCAGMPCQTPGVEAAPCAFPAPALRGRPSPAVEPAEPLSAEAPPPPTPPPTAVS